MLLTSENIERELRVRFLEICNVNTLDLPKMTLMRLRGVYDFIAAAGKSSPYPSEVITKVPGSMDDSFSVIFTIENLSVHEFDMQKFRDAVLSSEVFRVEKIDYNDDESAVKLTFTFPAKP